eukprot:COSAG03_NODE_183_length_10952_cov_150.888694_3_plen_41_part_00
MYESAYSPPRGAYTNPKFTTANAKATKAMAVIDGESSAER